jgi:hypothetical protein
MATDYTIDLRTWLLSLTGINGVATVHHNHVPEDKAVPFVWFAMASEQRDNCLDSAAGEEAMTQLFNIEICGTSLGGVVAIAKAIKDACPFRGALGTKTVQLCDVDNHDERYVPQNEFSDDVRHIQTLLLRIFP